MAGRQRLLGKDVEAGRGDLALSQELGERRLIDEGAARRVDEDGAGLGELEAASVEDAVSLVVQAEVQADDVGVGQDLVQRASAARHIVRYRAAIPADHTELERRAEPRRRAGNV